MALRCLIVDDNTEFLTAARDLLERQGVSVVGAATTGEEAVRCASELRPELALVDVDLGEESGFDLARRFAGLEHPEHVVLMSTYAEGDLDGLLDDRVVAGFLSKRDLSREAIDALLACANARRDR